MQAEQDDFNPLPHVLFGNPEVDVGPLYAPNDDYQVIGVTQTARYPEGRTVPQIAATFVLPGLPGSYIIRLDNYGFEHGDPLGRLRTRSAQLRELWSLPVARV